MLRGWIKLWRKLLDNPLMRRPAYRSVWIEILLRACHDGTSVSFGGKQIELDPGQFTTGAYQMSKATGVPRGTIERILKRFKSEELIEERTDGQCTLITVKKWNSYQKSEEANEERVRNDRGLKKNVRMKRRTTRVQTVGSEPLSGPVPKEHAVREVVNAYMDAQAFLDSQRVPAFREHVRPAKALLDAMNGNVEAAIMAIWECKKWSGTRTWTLRTVLNHLHRFVELS